MNLTETLNVALDFQTLFLNVGFVLLFIYLRARGGQGPMTTSQRWGLTILIWMFLLNSLTILQQFGDRTLWQDPSPEIISILYWFSMTTNIVIALLLLIFGLVYPRPILSWNRLQFVVLAIFGAMFMSVMYVSLYPDAPYLFMNLSPFGLFYTYGYFVPTIIWLSHFDKEPSPQVRMVLAFFIWGFMSAPTVGALNTYYYLVAGRVTLGLAGFIDSMFFTYILLYILYILWKTRAAWSPAEWTHVTFLFLFLLMSLNTLWYPEEGSVGAVIKGYGVTLMLWGIIRPALFAYVILRYQIFGTGLHIDTQLTFLLAGYCSISVVVLVLMTGVGGDATSLVLVGAVLGALAFYPFLKFSRRAISRILPLTGGEEKATIREKRTTYFMGLQTAVVNGRIDEAIDEERLVQQRRNLGVSEREHQLLMQSLMQKEGAQGRLGWVEELFLVHMDGRLIVHISRPGPLYKDAGTDKDILAGMLVSIRDYVNEGLQTQQTTLDAIKYGDYSLIIETEDQIVLAAVVNGPDTPAHRQALRDEVVFLIKRYGKVLTKWDGDHDKVEGVGPLLEEFMDEVGSG